MRTARSLLIIALLAGTALVAGCSSSGSKRSGGYYKDDGPGSSIPASIESTPDAVPRIEAQSRGTSRPYVIFGKRYVPLTGERAFRQEGRASWYGRKFHGNKTANGEIYDMYAMTAAHPTLPIPSYARVTNLSNGKSVIVRINDRGPFHPGRIIDLSYAAAWKLGYIAAGSAQVEVELLTPDLIAALAGNRRQAAAPPAAATAIAAATPVPPPQAALPGEPRQDLALDTQANGVFLQLAAFSARDNAESFRARIYRELDWLTGSIRILQQDGLFRLHVGPYRDRAEAGSMAERLRAELQLTPMIVVR